MGQRALLVGATGLIGQYCLNRLLADGEFSQVVVLARRPLAQQHAKLLEHIIDFERLADYGELFDVEAVFCCLGTTLKTAGSQQAFEKVDYGYVKTLATLAAEHGVATFLLISAVGANPRALAFYSRVKGRAEQAVCALPFRTVHILRPSLLLGPRRKQRLAEDLGKPLAQALSPLLQGPLARYRPVHADKVAELMVSLAKRDAAGVYIHYPSR